MEYNGRVLNKVERAGIFYSLFPIPYSLFLGTPHPPTLWKTFLCFQNWSNYKGFNNLNFSSVD
jgi:hypothetical protein